MATPNMITGTRTITITITIITTIDTIINPVIITTGTNTISNLKEA